MVSWNEAKTPQDFDLQAARHILQSTNESRAELRRDRDNAVRAGQPDLALQHSKDLRELHRDYLRIGLKVVSIRNSRIRSYRQKLGPESPRYQLFVKLLGREAGEVVFKRWKEANEKAEAQDYADEDQRGPGSAERDPYTAENLTPEAVRNEYTARMKDEKSFLENLKRVAQREGNSSLVRGCRKELRDLHLDLFERQMEISNFEEGNPPPVDPRAKEAETWEARSKFISKLREVAEKQGIISEHPE